jgi:hypothetical protein
LAVLVLGWSGSAAAEKKRVGVPRFDGPQEGVIRKAVMGVLRGDGYEVVGAGELDAAAKSAGAQLDSNDGFKAVAKELSISSFVTGEVSKKKAKLMVRNGADGSVSGEGAFGGANPAKIAADVRSSFSRRLGSAVERGRAPSGAKKPTPPAPVAEAETGGQEDNEKDTGKGGGEEDASKASKGAPVAAAKEKEEEAPAASGGAASEETAAKKAPEPEAEGGAAVGPRALDLSVGIGGFSRSLTYNQSIYPTLREYKLTLGPAAHFRAIVYPAAFATSGFLANLGLEADIEQAFGVTSSVAANPMSPTYPNGATFGTVIHDFYGGARVRVMLGPHEIAIRAGGGEHAFSFREGTDPNGNPVARAGLSIPDTIYQYFRIGLDSRFELPGGMTAGLSGAYRVVTNHAGQISIGPLFDPKTGELTEMGIFPYLTVGGVDFGAMLGYHITPSIEARASFDLRRYFYKMNSKNTVCPKDAMGVYQQCDFYVNGAGQIEQINQVAGGAVDQYVGFAVSAAYVWGGAAPRAASDEEPAAEAAPKKKKKKKKKSDEDEGDEGGDAGGDSGGGSSDE